MILDCVKVPVKNKPEKGRDVFEERLELWREAFPNFPRDSGTFLMCVPQQGPSAHTDSEYLSSKKKKKKKDKKKKFNGK